MIFPVKIEDNMLCLQDIILLEAIFANEVVSLLPLPGSVFFWHRQESSAASEEKKHWSQSQEEEFLSLCLSQSNKCLGDILFLPLPLQAGESAGVIIKDIDPMILGKMSPDYLLELQSDIQEKLLQVRKIYIEPMTGQYNTRCLDECLRAAAVRHGYNLLFIISVSFRSRNAVSCLQKNIQTAGLLTVISPVPVFNFNNGIFALALAVESGEQAFEFSHKLIKRLKREGAAKVHLGFSSFQATQPQETWENVLASCWQALSDAEKRGPYSFCSNQALDVNNAALLEKIASGPMACLRRAWKGLTGFGMVLFLADKTAGKMNNLQMSRQGLFRTDWINGEISQNEGYLLIPESSESRFKLYVKDLYKEMQKDRELTGVSLGACFWPCLQYSKASMVMNCRKALMHGSFLGSGQCIFFNHISLNVSGDYFFDEGNYRQAVKDYQQGLCLKPDDINLMNSLGVALIEINRLNPAVSWFKRVLQKKKDNYMALVNLGFTRRLQHQDREALICLEKAYHLISARKTEVSADLFLQLGRLYCQFGRFGDAVKVLDAWEEKGSGNQEFYLDRLRGEVYMECGRHDEGMQALQRALKLYPRDTESMSLLGLLYFEAGQGAEIGERFCRKAVVEDELNADNWQRLGRILFKLNNIDEAIEAVRNSIRLKRKNNFAARLLLGKIYEHKKQYYLAGKLYNGILKVAQGEDSIIKEVKSSLLGIKKYYLNPEKM